MQARIATNAAAHADRTARWAARGERAVPRLDVPSLRSVDPTVMDRLGPTAALLVVRPVVGVAGFVWMVASGWWLATPLLLWFLYGSTVSAMHHLIHGSVGFGPRTRHGLLTVLGFVILESGHAWQATHLLHHRDGSDLPDPEGFVENLGWRQLPLGALQWRFRIAAWGWRHSPRRRRTSVEIANVVALTVIAVALVPITWVPLAYVALMQLGTFLFAVLLAKGPQANFGRETTTPLMFVHTRLIGHLLFHHHLHVEHHAYPKVPMARLERLRPTVEAALADDEVVRVRLAV